MRSSAAADLWFHSVALTGYDAFGPVLLYESGYATGVRTARELRGAAPTRLERDAGAFRSAFAGDPAFEVLHFVPLYFPNSDVDELLDALTAVATVGERAADGVTARARFGVAAVALTLTTPEQRATLARFAVAVREEWVTAYRTERAEQADARATALEAAQRAWRERAAPAIAPILAQQSLDGGVILASPALGPEGRFFAGRPGNRTDNIVAVHLELAPAGAGDPAWLAVREMCFTSARQALADGGALPVDPGAAELAVGRAATRLGAVRLAASGAGALEEYRSALVRALGQSAPLDAAALESVFEMAYPVTAAAEASLGATTR